MPPAINVSVIKFERYFLIIVPKIIDRTFELMPGEMFPPMYGFTTGLIICASCMFKGEELFELIELD